MVDSELTQKLLCLLEKIQQIKSHKKDLFEFNKMSFNNRLEKEELNKVLLFLNLKERYDKLAQDLHECRLLKKEFEGKNKIGSDDQLIIEQEINLLERNRADLLEEAKELLIKEQNVEQNVLMEIRSGQGGDEAKLFAFDLYRMYNEFAGKNNWRVESIETQVDELGGFSFASLLIKGKEAFKYLKNESGVHRVQRIPRTEKRGRIHTSTASVVVLPEAKDINVEINPKDLKIETYRSSGAGGQHVNTTDSAVKVTYAYSNNGKTEVITATSQDGRSQHDNREKALKVLKSRLWDRHCQEQEQKIGNLRSSAIGTSKRSEKVRTYNYPKNKITDHRVEISWNNLDIIIEGDLQSICKALIDYEVSKQIDIYGEKIDDLLSSKKIY